MIRSTPFDLDRAIELYNEGKSVYQIGALLDLHGDLVRERLKSAGVIMRGRKIRVKKPKQPRISPPKDDKPERQFRPIFRPSPEEKQQILNWREAGMTWSDIAAKIDAPVCSVRKSVDTNGDLKRKTIDWNDDLIRRLLSLKDAGLSTSAIGRELGISKDAVIGKLHRVRDAA